MERNILIPVISFGKWNKQEFTNGSSDISSDAAIMQCI